jgi:hypothetical protein
LSVVVLIAPPHNTLSVPPLLTTSPYSVGPETL